MLSGNDAAGVDAGLGVGRENGRNRIDTQGDLFRGWFHGLSLGKRAGAAELAGGHIAAIERSS
jgi:hypothetical protein